MLPAYFNFIQIMRGLATVAVMLFHLNVTVWGIHGLDVFFVLSGFIIFYTSWDTLGTGVAGWRGYALRRVTRIYPTYWIFSLVSLLLYALLPAMAHPHTFEPGYLLRSFLLLPQEALPLVAVGWSLVFEMYFYLVFSLSFFLPRRLAWLLWVGWLCVILGMNALAPAEGEISLSLPHSPYALEFMFGAVAAYAVLRWPVVLRLRHVFLLAALVWGMVSLFLPHTFLWPYGRALGVGGATTWLTLACVGYEWRRPGLFARPWLVFLGDASYSTYLAHIMVFTALRLWLRPFWPEGGVLMEALWAGLLVAVAFFAGGVHYRLVERRLNKAARRAAGISS